MLDNAIGDAAEIRAKSLASEINAKSKASGCAHSACRVVGCAHTVGDAWRPRYDGHVEIRFEALTVAGPRRRTVNDCKRPIDVDKIVKMLVELQGYYDRQNEQRKREDAAYNANELTASNIRADSPAWLDISANASGISVEARGLTADKARAIVDALKALP